MAKKGATQGEKAATRTAKNQADNRRKALRRRTGDVKRVELQLNADCTRDQYIAKHLNALPYGTTSEYVRLAIEEKIACEIAGERHTMVDQNFASLVDDLRADNADLRTMLHEALDRLDDLQKREYTVTLEQAQRVTVSTTQAAEVASGGIDMSRPRKRPKLARAQPAQIETPDVLTEADSIRLAHQMADSIRKAQPGKG